MIIDGPNGSWKNLDEFVEAYPRARRKNKQSKKGFYSDSKDSKEKADSLARKRFRDVKNFQRNRFATEKNDYDEFVIRKPFSHY